MKKILVTFLISLILVSPLYSLEFNWSPDQWIIMLWKNDPMILPSTKISETNKFYLDWNLMKVIGKFQYKNPSLLPLPKTVNNTREAWKIAVYKDESYDELVGYMYIASDNFEMLGHEFILKKRRGFWTVDNVVRGIRGIGYSYPIWNSSLFGAKEQLKPRIAKLGTSETYFYSLNGKSDWNDSRHKRMYLEWNKNYPWFKVIEEVEPGSNSKQKFAKTFPLLKMTVSIADTPKVITPKVIKKLKKKYRRYFEQYEKH
jgi:hypothetical protein